MKSKLKKQLIAVMLCMVMIVSGNISTFAEADTNAAESVSEVQQASVIADEQNEPAMTSEVSGADSTEDTIAEESAAEPVAEEQTAEAVVEPTVEPATETAQEEAIAEQTPEPSETVPEEQKPLLKMQYEDDDIIANVSAKQDGIIPRDTTLKVVPILEEVKETKEQYKEVEKKIIEKAETEEYDITGFLAYDISFVDVDGNKVEPNGEVKVSLEYKNAVAPDQLDEETVKTSDVTVMHLEEDENGNVKEVVDLSKVNVSGQEENKIDTLVVNEAKEVEKTEFVTDSFSTFVVTWKYSRSIKKQITFLYCDENGKEINSQTTISIGEKDSGMYLDLSALEEDLPQIEGKEFVGTYIGTDFANKKKAIAVRASYSKSNKVWNYSYKDENGNERSISSIPTVFLVYRDKVEPDPGTEPETPPELVEPQPTISKKAMQKEGNLYDINLDISSSIGSQSSKAKLDIMLILDRSGSMQDNDKIKTAKASAIDLVNTLKNNKNLDINYSLVTFAGGTKYSDNSWSKVGSESDATIDQSWINSADQVINKINAVSNTPEGGTNYQAAFRKAKTLLANARQGKDVKRVVIFLTDGVPTYHIDGEGGLNKTSYTDVEKARSELALMTGVSSFYSIGFGNDFQDTGGEGQTILKALTEGGTISFSYLYYPYYQNVECNGAPAAIKKMHTAQNTTELKKVFSDIALDVTEVACDNVEVSDTLSGNVNSINATKYQFVITRTEDQQIVYCCDEENWGTNLTLDSITGTDQYDSTKDAKLKLQDLKGTKITFAGKKITCTYPTAYELSAEYTYSIVIQDVAVSTEAIMKYANTAAYTNRADEQTGTFENQLGFFSNDTAVMKYKVKGTDKSLEFKKPVVQVEVPRTEHTVKKVWSGVEDSNITPVEVELVAEITIDSSGTTKQLSHSDYALLPETMKITLSNDNQWQNKWENLPSIYYYTENGEAKQKDIRYSVKENLTPGQKELFSSSSECSADGKTTTITNTKNTVGDLPFIRIEKTFKGIANPKAVLKTFKILLYSDPNCSQLVKTLYMKDAEQETTGTDGSVTYVWKVENQEAGTYYVKEDNWQQEGYDLTTTVNGTQVGPTTGTTVITKPAELSINAGYKWITPNSTTEFPFNDSNFIVGSLTSSEGYFIWTKDTLSSAERIKLVSNIQSLNIANFKKITVETTRFFSTKDKIEQGINYHGTVTVKDGKLTFDATAQWSMVIYGSYTMSEKQNAEISITNEYQSKPATIDLQKYGTVISPDEKNQLEAIFELSKLDDKIWKKVNDVTVNKDNVELRNLEAGIYKLEEKQAPVGYMLLKQSIYFMVDKGSVTLTDAFGNSVDNPQSMWESSKKSDGTYVIKIKNNVSYDLPEAGGIGIYWYIISGMLLMIAAALIIYKNKGREVLNK